MFRHLVLGGRTLALPAATDETPFADGLRRGRFFRGTWLNQVNVSARTGILLLGNEHAWRMHSLQWQMINAVMPLELLRILGDQLDVLDRSADSQPLGHNEHSPHWFIVSDSGVGFRYHRAHVVRHEQALVACRPVQNDFVRRTRQAGGVSPHNIEMSKTCAAGREG